MDQRKRDVESKIIDPETAESGVRTVSRRALVAGAGAAGGMALLGSLSPLAAQDTASPAASPGASPVAGATPVAGASGPRVAQLLREGWRFVKDDGLTPEEALDASDENWEQVTLPHTWNAIDAASLDAEGYDRGLGWYKLSFPTPRKGSDTGSRSAPPAWSPRSG